MRKLCCTAIYSYLISTPLELTILASLDRIHSWAKAHASSRGLTDQSPQQADVPAEKPPPENGQVNVPVEDPTPGSDTEPNSKPGLLIRMRNGSGRFYNHTKDALCHSWVN